MPGPVVLFFGREKDLQQASTLALKASLEEQSYEIVLCSNIQHVKKEKIDLCVYVCLDPPIFPFVHLQNFIKERGLFKPLALVSHKSQALFKDPHVFEHIFNISQKEEIIHYIESYNEGASTQVEAVKILPENAPPQMLNVADFGLKEAKLVLETGSHTNEDEKTQVSQSLDHRVSKELSADVPHVQEMPSIELPSQGTWGTSQGAEVVHELSLGSLQNKVPADLPQLDLPSEALQPIGELEAGNIPAPGADIGQLLSEMPFDSPENYEAEHEPAADREAFVHGNGRDELLTLRQYVQMKEREIRQKEEAISALQSQMDKLKKLFEKSEDERRSLQLQYDELLSTKKVVEEERDQLKYNLQKADEVRQNQMREFQIKIDNLNFQNSRANKKLQEFREKVKADIVKIRARERELYNKLELQKRDADALLAVKDERLLAQKREMDRLQFEIENMRERLIEETQKAEDRMARLTRALQSLKMAEAMLAGMSEEVLPGAKDKVPDDEGGGERAA